MKSENSVKEIERIRELLMLNEASGPTPKLAAAIQSIEDRLRASDRKISENVCKLEEQAKRISKLETMIAVQSEEIEDLKSTQVGVLGRVTKRITNRE